jgi:hypothetical protein
MADRAIEKTEQGREQDLFTALIVSAEAFADSSATALETASLSSRRAKAGRPCVLVAFSSQP